MENPFDLSKTQSSQANSTAGTFNANAPANGQYAAITPSTGSTVAGQMNSLLSSESPYIQRARTRAAQQSNSRGLLNSSIAAGAGEAAAIDAALPIAQQDAGTFFTAQRANQDAGNQLGLVNQQFRNQQTLQDDSQAFAGEQAGLDRAQQTNLQNSQNQFVGQQSALDRTQQMGILNRELQSIEGRQTQQIQSTERLANADNQLRQTLLNTQIRGEQDLTTLRASLEQEQAAFLAQIQDEQALLDITRGRNANMQQYQLQMGNEYLNDVNALLANPEIPANLKEQAIAQMRTQYQTLLDLAGTLSNTPVLRAGQAGV